MNPLMIRGEQVEVKFTLAQDSANVSVSTRNHVTGQWQLVEIVPVNREQLQGLGQALATHFAKWSLQVIPVAKKLRLSLGLFLERDESKDVDLPPEWEQMTEATKRLWCEAKLKDFVAGNMAPEWYIV